MRTRTKPRTGDIIRDYTENDIAMKNWWNAGGKHVQYRIYDIKKDKIVGIRLNSPTHHGESKFKNFDLNMVKPISQTIGIFGYRNI